MENKQKSKVNKEKILKAFRDVLRAIKGINKDKGVLDDSYLEELEGLTIDQAHQALNHKIAPKLFINTDIIGLVIY